MDPAVRQRLRPVERMIVPATALGKRTKLWYDPQSPIGQVYQEVVVPPELRVIKPSFWRFPCRTCCDKKLRRVHAHCLLACKMRKVWRGKIPSIYPTRIYAYTIRLDRPHPRLRNWLMKRLSEALEWLA